MSWPPPDGTSYQPSNGTEGQVFFSGWCDKCHRDRAYQLDPDQNDGCPIIANSMAYSLGHAKYPKEWVWKEGEPICTAFLDIAGEPERITELERAANLELPL